MAISRRVIVSAFAVVVIGLGLYGPVSPASAQTGYGDPCNPPTSTQPLGSLDVGRTQTFLLAPPCTLTPAAPLTVTVNGVNIPGKVANANGGVGVQVKVVSQTLLEIDDPVNVPAVCGSNSIVVRGPSRVAAGVTVNHTGTFNVVCTGAVARTGSSSTMWVGVAGALLVAGAGLVMVGRRRSTRWGTAA